jgi:N-acetylmuramoyl-L-alanine amidase
MREKKVFILQKRPTAIILSLLGLLLVVTAALSVQAPEEQLVLSYALSNKVIVVDAGHGGVDPGAIGPQQILEKDITLAISRKLAERLSQAGALVIPTRTYDEDLAGDEFTGSIRQRKQADMAKRVAQANVNQADFLISIHTNAETSRQWKGAQVFYDAHDPESKRIAEAIQAALKQELKNTDRTAKAASYYLMTKTDMPAILIEVGFISNPEEEKLLCTDEYQSRIAHAIFSGLVQSQITGD